MDTPTAVHERDPLADYLQEPPVTILREIEDDLEVPSGVSVRRVVYASVQTPDGATNEVYAVIARPAGGGTYPGLLLLHGGGGCAEVGPALVWAQRGYVVVTPDLPGIANPEKVPHSRGTWTGQPYGTGRWDLEPDVTAATIYQAVVAALQAFALLRTQSDVDVNHIGVTGTSWGGYMTTMVCGLMGSRIQAGFSNYGTGFFEDTVFVKELNKLPEHTRAIWFEHFDAGCRANGITAPFFIAGASNDTFFQPPAVEKTLAAASGPVGRVHAPNAHHMLPIPGGTPDCGSPAAMAAEWFAWHLQGRGAPFPEVEIDAPDDTRAVVFRVRGAKTPSDAAVWYSAPATEGGWPKRVWEKLPAEQTASGVYRATLPEVCGGPGAAWFAMVSEGDSVTVSSPMVFG